MASRTCLAEVLRWCNDMGLGLDEEQFLGLREEDLVDGVIVEEDTLAEVPNVEVMHENKQ